MKVPFRLQKRAAAEPPSALLLYSGSPADVVDLCERLGEAPKLFPVADGFLLIPCQPVRVRPAQTIGLRRLGENLYVPCDADLLPALLDDEVAGLTRKRGLIFLPGNRALAFDPDSPRTLVQLLHVRRAPHRAWQTFPRPRTLPERIHRLERVAPPLEQILEQGGEGIGEEAPAPDAAGGPSTALGAASAGLGKGLLWLGNLLNWKGLAGLGASWIAGALQRAPRLSESILGKQEAALRALLKDFRDGKLEKALRRALPIGGEGGRGGVAATGAQLPTHNLRFTLGDLLGRRGGPGSLWFGGGDVQQQLIQEYRKAARDAEARGDFRRAAFIFAKLLFDYRAAADALKRGGHYREAAVLYLEKLNDPLSAAQAFEAAGEVDCAVQLYRQQGDHARAGELLKRVGEEEAALVEFQTAAGNLLRTRQAYLEAGELMLYKAERVDLALGYFEEGWRLRPAAMSVACAFHLTRLYVQERQGDTLLGLVGEAERYFAPQRAGALAGEFFNLLATLADDPKAAPWRDELRDRARMALAVTMRQYVEVNTRPGKAVSNLFGKNPAWAPGLVSDADFALKAALRKPGTRPAARPPETHSVRVSSGLVTAACHATVEGTLFLGFSDGKVVAYRLTVGAVVPIDFLIDGVSSMAVDPLGKLLVVQRGRPSPERLHGHEFILHSYVLSSASGDYVFSTSRAGATEEPAWLTYGAGGSEHFTGWWHGSGFQLLKGAGLTLEQGYAVPDHDCRAGFLIQGGDRPVQVFFAGPWVGYLDPENERAPVRTSTFFWSPAVPEGNPLLSVPLAWSEDEDSCVEVAGLDREGCLHYTVIFFDGPDPRVQGTNTAVRPEGYLAVALVQAGLVAGVSRSHIDWLRAGNKEFTRVTTTPVSLRSAIACFVSHRTAELLVVCSEGEVVRVPIPGAV